jgi:endonuclease III
VRLQVSPYNTRQEQYRDEPWKMLMVCFMLNQTSHKQVDQVRHEFFLRYPDAKAVLDAPDQEIVELIRPLGFYNKRVKAWKKFCQQWLDVGQDAPGLAQLMEMSGVGKYALDSWKVFQLYQYDTQVDDHVLNWYVTWARVEVERLAREAHEAKPHVVHYLHYRDDRHMDPNWMVCQDYAACVMARTMQEAREKVEAIAMKSPGAVRIKVVGVTMGKPEWVNEASPITTDESAYRQRRNQIMKMNSSPFL